MNFLAYAITEISPSPNSIQVRKLGGFLELRTPILVVGEYQGGNRELPDGTIVEQPKIYYPPSILPILAKSALGKVGDVEHSDSKFDVVSVLRETDTTDPNILYATILVHNQEMIKEILAGNYQGVSIQAQVQADFNKETGRYEATGGEILAYGHTSNPAVPGAIIESMQSIHLSHNIIESFNKKKIENSTITKDKTKSVHIMTNEDKVVELSAKVAEQSVMLSDRDTKIELLSTEKNTVSTELEQSVASVIERDATIVELTKKISEMETETQLKEQEVQEKELTIILAEIKKLDDKFDSKAYLHASMNYESKKLILEAILTDKQKLSKGITLSGLPASGGDELDEEKLKQALGGIPLEVALGGRDQTLFW